MPVVVCVNCFASDTDAELAVVLNGTKSFGTVDAVVASNWAHASLRSVALRKAVVSEIDNDVLQTARFKFLYNDGLTICQRCSC